MKITVQIVIDAQDGTPQSAAWGSRRRDFTSRNPWRFTRLRVGPRGCSPWLPLREDYGGSFRRACARPVSDCR